MNETYLATLRNASRGQINPRATAADLEAKSRLGDPEPDAGLAFEMPGRARPDVQRAL
jgi:hypothetical protein